MAADTRARRRRWTAYEERVLRHSIAEVTGCTPADVAPGLSTLLHALVYRPGDEVPGMVVACLEATPDDEGSA